MANPIDPPSGLPVPRRTDKGPRRKRQGRIPGPGGTQEPPQKPVNPGEPPKKTEPDACSEPPSEAKIATAKRAVQATGKAVDETQARVDKAQADVEKSEGEPGKSRTPLETTQKKVYEITAEIARSEEERARIDREDPPITRRYYTASPRVGV